MPCNAEFGIIDSIDTDLLKEYDYEPKRYGCTAIDDDALEGWQERLLEMESYFHRLGRPEHGLARWGITLIPPRSLALFYDIVKNDTDIKFSDQAEGLLLKIEEAMRCEKFMIHYGV